jgi:hypothetical protein
MCQPNKRSLQNGKRSLSTNLEIQRGLLALATKYGYPTYPRGVHSAEEMVQIKSLAAEHFFHPSLSRDKFIKYNGIIFPLNSPLHDGDKPQEGVLVNRNGYPFNTPSFNQLSPDKIENTELFKMVLFVPETAAFDPPNRDSSSKSWQGLSTTSSILKRRSGKTSAFNHQTRTW